MIDEKLIKLAVDGYAGRLGNEYSVGESQEVLRKALIEANGGKNYLDIKAIRDGECKGLFAITEVLIQKVSEEGLKGDEFFTNFIEDRNKALGDSDIFHTTKDTMLAVADIAAGTQGVRRQRIEAGQDIRIATKPQAVKIYEELNRILAGRVDFNHMIDLVGKSFTQADLDDAYVSFNGMVGSLSATYSQSGTYNEEKLLDLIEHVEASTGESASIIGTRKALRKVNPSVMGNEAKSDIYSMGYVGRLAGAPLIAMKQRHKVGTTQFILPDDTLYVIAGNDKPIKRVTEGTVTMLMGDPMKNADLSQEFVMLKNTGTGIVMARDFGVYKMS